MTSEHQLGSGLEMSTTTPLLNWWKRRLFIKPKTPQSLSFSSTSSEESPVVNSPITELALNIEDLSTASRTACGSVSSRRKILVDGSAGMEFRRQESVDEGCSVEVPRLDALNFGQDSFMLGRKNASVKKFKVLPLSSYGFLPLGTPKSKRQSSLTSSCKRQSAVTLDCRRKSNVTKSSLAALQKIADAVLPTEREDESSQDSGIGFDKDDFKVPRLPMSQLSGGRFSNSTPKKLGPRSRAKVCLFRTSSHLPGSPAFQTLDKDVRSKRESVQNENFDADDGFIDMSDNENDFTVRRPPSNNVSAAISDNIGQKSPRIQLPNSKKRLRMQPEVEEPTVSTRRNLFSMSHLKLSRCQSFDVGPSPVTVCRENTDGSKRCKFSDTCEASSPVTYSKVLSIAPVRRLVRCQSEAAIKSALMMSDGQCGDLIGDFSQSYCLPVSPSRHQDLRAISPNTMAKILNDEFESCMPKYFIIDCRYPYEFDAGHLLGAQNIYSEESIIEQFFSSEAISSANSIAKRRPVLIFHCEFSSERGPKLMRFLRNTDRDCNKDCYPALHYPELYLLEGGYKAFFQLHPDRCEPRGYKPMIHKDHASDLKHFRSKTRSQNQNFVVNLPK